MEQASEEAINQEDYYRVEKIFDMKQQGGKRYYLVKWHGWDVKTCTWQEEKNVAHLKSLINQYRESRKHDLQNNIAIKKFEQVRPGASPYEATKYHGHVLYGDEPQKIISIQGIERNDKKEVHLQIEWKARDNGFKPTNSVIESKLLLEHAPRFLIEFYQSKVRLMSESS